MMYNNIDFNNKTILITGGAGFIGSNLAFYFQENFPNSKVIVFDCFRSTEIFANGNLKSFGHYKNLVGFKGRVICGNINNQADLALLADYKFDFVFHQAAISDTRIYDQEIIMKTNVNSFYDLLAITKKNQAVMVYASSAATYPPIDRPTGIKLPFWLARISSAIAVMLAWPHVLACVMVISGRDFNTSSCAKNKFFVRINPGINTIL